MITLIASVKVKDGNMEKAIEVLKKLVPKVRESEPGCLEYIPHTVKGYNMLIQVLTSIPGSSRGENSAIFFGKFAICTFNASSSLYFS